MPERLTDQHLDAPTPAVKPEWVSGLKASEETSTELLHLIETIAASGYESPGTSFKMLTLPKGKTSGKVTLIIQTQAGRLKHPSSAYASCHLHGKDYQGMRIHYTDPDNTAPWLLGLPCTEAAAQEALKVIKENFKKAD